VTKVPSDRIVGTLCLLVAALTAMEARTFTVHFLTDPIGPKALPFLVAVMFALAGGSLLAHPQLEPSWPSRATWMRGGLAVSSLVLYAFILRFLGFFVSTALEVTALALLFKGPLAKSTVAAVLYSGLLYLLFVYAFGLSLPIGSLFLGGD